MEVTSNDGDGDDDGVEVAAVGYRDYYQTTIYYYYSFPVPMT